MGVLLAVAMCAAAMGAAPPRGFVQADGPGLVRNGRPFRAVGFSQPDLFSSVLLGGEEGRRKSFDAIRDARRSGVRFLRFWASGFWPRDMKRYFADPAGYWAAMDEVFAFASQQDVMLIPSIFWQTYLWPDLCDEPRRAIADPSSRTYAAMRAYLETLVSRYRDDPNVLLWEIGNEYYLEADLNPKYHAKAMGAGGRNLGTRAERTQDDALTSETLRAFYVDVAAHIRRLDAHHLIAGGDSGPRPTSRSLRASFPRNVFAPDSLRDYVNSMLEACPAPLDVLSIHFYGNPNGTFPPGKPTQRVGGVSTRSPDMLASLARAARSVRTPLMVGELGQMDPDIRDDPKAHFMRSAIDLLEREGASLIGLWVWRFPPQPQWTVAGDRYPKLMRRVRSFNRRYAQGPKR